MNKISYKNSDKKTSFIKNENNKNFDLIADKWSLSKNQVYFHIINVLS